MKLKKYRNELRKLTIDFMYDKYETTLDRRIKGDWSVKG